MIKYRCSYCILHMSVCNCIWSIYRSVYLHGFCEKLSDIIVRIGYKLCECLVFRSSILHIKLVLCAAQINQISQCTLSSINYIILELGACFHNFITKHFMPCQSWFIFLDRCSLPHLYGRPHLFTIISYVSQTLFSCLSLPQL